MCDAHAGAVRRTEGRAALQLGTEGSSMEWSFRVRFSVGRAGASMRDIPRARVSRYRSQQPHA